MRRAVLSAGTTMIACVYAAHFVATIERAAHGVAPARPLIVCTDAQPSRVVAACALATARGVRGGMTEALARAHCPEARVVAALVARSVSATQDITALLSTWSARVLCGNVDVRSSRRRHTCSERPGAAWWFLDLGRVRATDALDLAPAITAAVAQHHGLTVAVAVAPTRFTAWCAAVSQGTCYVPAERAASLLAPLPIGLLPLDEPTALELDQLGLRTLGQLAALPRGALETQCGGAGRLLRQLARGDDRDPIPAYVPESTLRATRHADGAATDAHMIDHALGTMATQLADRLTRRGQAARVVVLRMSLADGSAWADARVLDTPTAQPEVLCDALYGLRRRVQFRSGVEQIDVVLRDLGAVHVTQLSLFDESGAPSRARQQTLVTALIARFGPERLLRIHARIPGARVPEQRYRLDPARDG